MLSLFTPLGLIIMGLPFLALILLLKNYPKEYRVTVFWVGIIASFLVVMHLFGTSIAEKENVEIIEAYEKQIQSLMSQNNELNQLTRKMADHTNCLRDRIMIGDGDCRTTSEAYEKALNDYNETYK